MAAFESEGSSRRSSQVLYSRRETQSDGEPKLDIRKPIIIRIRGSVYCEVSTFKLAVKGGLNQSHTLCDLSAFHRHHIHHLSHQLWLNVTAPYRYIRKPHAMQEIMHQASSDVLPRTSRMEYGAWSTRVSSSSLHDTSQYNGTFSLEVVTLPESSSHATPSAPKFSYCAPSSPTPLPGLRPPGRPTCSAVIRKSGTLPPITRSCSNRIPSSVT